MGREKRRERGREGRGGEGEKGRRGGGKGRDSFIHLSLQNTGLFLLSMNFAPTNKNNIHSSYTESATVSC